MTTKQADSNQTGRNPMFDPDKTVAAPLPELLIHACRYWTDFEVSTITGLDDDDDFGPSASTSDSTRINLKCVPDIDDFAMPDHNGTCPNLRCLD